MGTFFLDQDFDIQVISVGRQGAAVGVVVHAVGIVGQVKVTDDRMLLLLEQIDVPATTISHRPTGLVAKSEEKFVADAAFPFFEQQQSV